MYLSAYAVRRSFQAGLDAMRLHFHLTFPSSRLALLNDTAVVELLRHWEE